LCTYLNSGNIELVEDESNHNSATLQLQYNRPDNPDLVIDYIGTVAGSGEITVSNDDDLIVDLDLTGLDVDLDGTKQSPTEGTLDKDKFSFADTSSNLTMFGVEFTRLNDFSVSIDKNIDPKNYINNNNPEKPDEIILQGSTIEIEAEIDVSSDDIYRELLDGDNSFAMNIAFTRSNGDEIVINPTNCKITEAPHEVPDEGSVSVPVSISSEGLTVQFNKAP
jgi:type VI protein secretion system component Hcp